MIESTIKKWVTTLGRSDEFFRRAIIENREEILDLNVAQLEIGENALGNLLDTYTTREYSEFKKALGSKAPFGVADLTNWYSTDIDDAPRGSSWSIGADQPPAVR